MVRKRGIQYESSLPEDSSLQHFFERVDTVQARITSLSKRINSEETGKDTLFGQLFNELNLLMEELHVAVEELHAQNKELSLARDKIEKERQKYQNLFHLAPDGYLVTDHNGLILDANQAAGDMLNESPQYLVRKPFSLYIEEENRKEFRGKLNRLGAPDKTPGNRIENWEFRIKPRSGNPIDVSATVTAIRSDHQSLEGAVLFRWLIRNMNAQKRFQSEINEIKHELLKSRERTRQQLARSLHDGTVQDLHGVIFQLKPLESNINQPRLRNSIDSIETQLIDIVRELRQICSDLRPPVLIPFGLDKAIQSHAGTLHETHPEILLNLKLAPDVPSLHEEIHLALFQIYRQVMANVLRHADAQNVWVRLRRESTSIYLEVEDDGKGFVVPKSWIELVRHHHYGLADVAERAESIGGKLEVYSRPLQGTKVRVLFPLEQTEVRGESVDADE